MVYPLILKEIYQTQGVFMQIKEEIGKSRTVLHCATLKKSGADLN
jgi:hypothetical protein